MNIKQLRFIVEISRQELSVSRAAAALHISQPGISKQVLLLEEELGFHIFTRARSRLVGLTPEGARVVDYAEKALEQISNIQRVSQERKRPSARVISIATSHTQARYVLSEIMRNFSAKFPRVNIRLRLGNPQQIAEMVLSGEADIGITTDPTDGIKELVSLPYRKFERIVIVPRGHELLKEKNVTLKKLAHFPLIAYEPQFTGWHALANAFKRGGLTPKVVISAIDADVIKTCVEQGMGIAVLSEMTFNPDRDIALSAIRTGDMFAPATTNFLLHRKRYLPNYTYDFIETCLPAWTKANLHKMEI